MKRINLFFALAITALSSSVVNAALVQYAYTGNSFDNIPYDPGAPTSISLQFILDDTLIPKNGRFALDIANPTEDNTPFKAGSFGIVAPSGWIYSPNESIFLSVDFDSDLDDNITERWSIQVNGSSTDSTSGGHFDTYFSFETQYDATLFQGSDQSHLLYRGGGYDLSNFNKPGTWTRSLVPVPIPPGIILCGSVLGLINLRRIYNNFLKGVLLPLRYVAFHDAN
jgi:hypothetical protein